MGIRTVKPTSPARRYMTFVTNDEITKNDAGEEPARCRSGAPTAATVPAASRCGTGAAGPSGCSGEVDFRREKLGIPARVAAIEYDPNRSARHRAALLSRRREALHHRAATASRSGDMVMSGPQADILPGNALPIRNIPLGTLVHNVELQPGQGRRRCAGARAPWPSCWPRKATTPTSSCPRARCGRSASSAWPRSARSATSTTRTSRSARPGACAGRASGPTVRGTVMNPVDHPMGGGEGKGKGNHPMTPWGKPTKGYKTRRGARPSDRYIVTRRTK